MQFTDLLLHWYEENKRSLPWRGERDVYRVWVSEIILQQTRIQQGWDYYLRFIEAFPDVQALAAAPEEEVLRLWQGLGYYSRARNMHAAAKSIVIQHNGIFPQQYDDIRKLKGVGDYTAAAIASFAYGQPYPAIDGNALRIITRVFGIHDNIMAGTTKKVITRQCQQLIQKVNPADFNQAMMDFGSLQCIPKHPKCEKCTLKDECYAFLHEEVDLLPISIKNLKIKNRYFHFFILKDKKERLLIEKREADDIWKNLYQLPMLETAEATVLEGIRLVHSAKHQLTHQTLWANFYVVPFDYPLPSAQGPRTYVSIKQLSNYAFPALIVKVMKEL